MEFHPPESHPEFCLKVSFLSTVLTWEAKKSKPKKFKNNNSFLTHHSARELDGLALSLTPLISKMGLFTALTTCKAFSILPDTKRSINGSIYYCCYYYVIILLAPAYALPLPGYILSSKTQQNRIWISESKLFSPHFASEWTQYFQDFLLSQWKRSSS